MRRAAATLLLGALIAAGLGSCRGGGPAQDQAVDGTDAPPAGTAGEAGDQVASAQGEAGAGAPGSAPAGDAGAAPAGPGAPTTTFLTEENRREVMLFFQDRDQDLLGAERRRIFETNSIGDQAKQIVVEVINGPERGDLLPTLPAETRVLGLYIDRSGTAYVDLSEEASSLHPGGASEEIASVFSIVNSLTFNLQAIKRVHFLIGGEERDTLKNHLDLQRDFVRDLSIVRPEDAVARRGGAG